MSSEQRNRARKPRAFEIYVYRTTVAAAGNSLVMSRVTLLSNQHIGELQRPKLFSGHQSSWQAQADALDPHTEE